MLNPPSDRLITAAQYTPHVHRTQYNAINPVLPSNSQAGKIIIITGASQGLGRQGFAPAFAKAGAKGIVLVARNSERLAQTASEINKISPQTEVMEIAADITDPKSAKIIFDEISARYGTADVLVNNSGVMGDLGPIAVIPESTWWRDFEVNVKGTFLITQGFLNLVGADKKVTVINVSTGAALGIYPYVSAYSISKLATIQLSAYVAAENPNITSIAIHPGVVKTALIPENSPFRPFSDDDDSLCGGLAVWLATPAATFLNGRYVNASWDVTDLIAQKEKIIANNDLVIRLSGKFGADQFVGV